MEVSEIRAYESFKDKVCLFMLYMGQLKELDLIAGDGPALTGPGYDQAMNVQESGLKLQEEEVYEILGEMIEFGNGSMDEETKGVFVKLIMELQTIGYVEMKEKVAAAAIRMKEEEEQRKAEENNLKKKKRTLGQFFNDVLSLMFK